MLLTTELLAWVSGTVRPVLICCIILLAKLNIMISSKCVIFNMVPYCTILKMTPKPTVLKMTPKCPNLKRRLSDG